MRRVPDPPSPPNLTPRFENFADIVDDGESQVMIDAKRKAQVNRLSLVTKCFPFMECISRNFGSAKPSFEVKIFEFVRFYLLNLKTAII